MLLLLLVLLQVDWSEEIVCLHGIAFLLAEAYTTVDDSSAAVPAEATAAAEEASAESNEHARLQHQQKQDQSSSSSNTLLSQQKACLREEAATQRYAWEGKAMICFCCCWRTLPSVAVLPLFSFAAGTAAAAAAAATAAAIAAAGIAATLTSKWLLAQRPGGCSAMSSCLPFVSTGKLTSLIGICCRR